MEPHEVPPLFQSDNEVGNIALLDSGISFLEDKVQEIGNEIEDRKVKSKKKKKKNEVNIVVKFSI